MSNEADCSVTGRERRTSISFCLGNCRSKKQPITRSRRQPDASIYDDTASTLDVSPALFAIGDCATGTVLGSGNSERFIVSVVRSVVAGAISSGGAVV